MTTGVVTAAPEMSFRELVDTMAENGIGALPVLDRLGCPVGVVYESNVLGEPEAGEWRAHRVGRRRWHSAPDWTAAEVMTTPVRAVHVSEPVSFVERLLANGGFRRLFVTDWDDRLVGVVSRCDLIRAHPHDKLETVCHSGSW